ncbi:uncharacterized protein LOC123037735 [Drosophila rhopaloa]|uniref:Uncharacterized protein n=1 Tax=Drosophila rhopaloa TaxID=1041015 RepID=A0ABM5JA53_DRORH|nr:uncharacterized protein LOC123037735 [Drosophila rhopaloa]
MTCPLKSLDGRLECYNLFLWQSILDSLRRAHNGEVNNRKKRKYDTASCDQRKLNIRIILPGGSVVVLLPRLFLFFFFMVFGSWQSLLLKPLSFSFPSSQPLPLPPPPSPSALSTILSRHRQKCWLSA